ncbi:hypothetical protein NIES2119_14040 [[Phormidium ambiguum] IAM M-71]|uniref:Circadian input-output histidine kinase CikA n=1 Tax=[Phormidium ambiguum] IAM M-71 TaxID=454136 RepID=A0A1U7IJP8_9CYAN|nr:ATP-binding protein [Phormidium ambiguum]OKH37362.1 hypothetical protein NIES2119_14040 [Phormidium ambiguum IAM M-71]
MFNLFCLSAKHQSAQSSPEIDRTLQCETLIDLAPDAIFIADLNGIYTEVNHQACQLLGYSREELLGKSIADLIPQEDLLKLIAVRDFLIQGNTQIDTWTHLHKDGSRIPTEVSAKILPDGRWVAFVRDIRSRQQAELALREKALQERNSHIQLLYETTRDLLSANQPLTLVKTLFAKLKDIVGLDAYFNYVLDEERQKLHLMFCGGISDEIARDIEWLDLGCAVCGTVAQKRYQMLQFDVQHSDDPKTQLVRSLGITAYACQPLISQGKLFGTLSFGSKTRTTFSPTETELFQVLCDQIAIALERSQLIASLQEQTEELKQNDRLKDNFFSALSHELRTPLNPILGWTKLLQTETLSSAQVSQALQTIDRNVQQQIRLVDDLLDMCCVIQGKMRLETHPVNLGFTIKNAVETVEFAAQAKAIDLRLHLTDAIYTLGDGDRLQQVFWNLLSNAIKFTPKGGRIDVDLSLVSSHSTWGEEKVTNNKYAQIRIRDTGIGIDSGFLPHIFEYFRQAEGGSTRRYGGLGLGLAIVHHLVELHGGTIKAESPGLNQGAVFTVKLPLLNNDNPLKKINPIEPRKIDYIDRNFIESFNVSLSPESSYITTTIINSAGSLGGIQIALVDDDPDNLELLRFLLSEEGAKVKAFNSPEKALEAIAKSPPDLLVSDIGMPEMNGYEFIQKVRALPSQQRRNFPAIALSAFAQKIDQEKAIEAGYQAYITKPVDPLQAIATVAQFI